MHYLHMNPDPNVASEDRSQYELGTFIYPGIEGEVDPFYLENNKNPLIATVSTKTRVGFKKRDQEYKDPESVIIFQGCTILFITLLYFLL